MTRKIYPQPRLELVSVPTPDNGVVGALHFFPDGPSRGMLILIPGLHGPIISMHDYQPLAVAVTGRGFELLLVQMRSALDWANAVFAHTLIDLQAAIDYAKGRGVTDISLFGTSLGGCRVMYYHSQGADPAVRTTGFLASIASPYLELKLRSPERLPILDEALKRARALVAAGQPEEPVRYDWQPGRAQIQSARTFIEYFGTLDESDCSTVKWGHTVKVPALVLHGTGDEIAVAANAEAIHDSLVNAPSRELMWLEDATHYLQSGWIAEDYAEMIAEWVDRMMPQSSKIHAVK